jgi:hypothetical protein
MLVLPALASLQSSNVVVAQTLDKALHRLACSKLTGMGHDRLRISGEWLGEASRPDRHWLSLSAAAHIKVRQTTGIALPKGMIPAYLLLSLLSCQLIEYKIWKLEII